MSDTNTSEVDLAEKYKDLLTEQTIKSFSMKNRIGRDEAKAKLIENFEKESSSVDSRAIALKAIGAMRQISPKVRGLELREQDTIHKLSNHESRLNVQAELIDKLTITIINLQQKPQQKGLFKWILSSFKNFLQKKKRG